MGYSLIIRPLDKAHYVACDARRIARNLSLTVRDDCVINEEPVRDEPEDPTSAVLPYSAKLSRNDKTR